MKKVSGDGWLQMRKSAAEFERRHKMDNKNEIGSNEAMIEKAETPYFSMSNMDEETLLILMDDRIATGG